MEAAKYTQGTRAGSPGRVPVGNGCPSEAPLQRRAGSFYNEYMGKRKLEKSRRRPGGRGMRKTIGILAHVDAGKTTLSEAVLYHGKAIRAKGRVDHRDSFLDADALRSSGASLCFRAGGLFSGRKPILPGRHAGTRRLRRGKWNGLWGCWTMPFWW